MKNKTKYNTIMFKYLKNKFLWWKLRCEQKKRHRYQDQFNKLLKDILAKIQRNLKHESIILYYSEEDISYKIVYNVYVYLKSIGYNILFSQECDADQMIQQIINYYKLSIKLR